LVPADDGVGRVTLEGNVSLGNQGPNTPEGNEKKMVKTGFGNTPKQSEVQNYGNASREHHKKLRNECCLVEETKKKKDDWDGRALQKNSSGNHPARPAR